MPVPGLTEEEKVRVRHHLDYLNVTEAYTMTAGTPAAVEPQFFIEGAMVRLKDEALPLFRVLLARCDATEGQMFDDQENHAVRKIGDIEINPDEFGTLTQRYDYWRGKLANMLGVYVNPWSKSGGNGLNVPVAQ